MGNHKIRAIEARRQDADFRKRLEGSIDRNEEILERLGG